MDSPKGLCIEVRNGDVNKALRIFKKKVQEEGVLQEYKERQHYVKPSEKKRLAKKRGIARVKKEMAKLARSL